MARKATGIYQRGKTWWITYMGSDGQQQWESSGSKLKADADYLLACRKKEIAEGLVPVTSNRKKFTTTFDELAVKYLEFCKPQKGYKTKVGRIGTLRRFFGDMKLVEITLESLETYQAQRQAEHKQPKKEGGEVGTLVKAATVNRELATLKNMFTKADQWGLIPPAVLKVARSVKLTREDNSRLRFLSIVESKDLIGACSGSIKEIVTFAINTGCRRGEIFSLVWEHVDLKHGFIRIAGDKSKNGVSRDIPVNENLAVTLKAILARREAPYVFVNPVTGTRYCDGSRGSRESAMFTVNVGCSRDEIFSLTWEDVDLKRGLIKIAKSKNGADRNIRIKAALIEKLKLIERRHKTPYVFFNPETGTRYKDIKKSFATACQNASIMDFHFHDLRHTFASHLVMAGVDLTTVSRLMGHKTLTMTLRYAHLAPDHLKRAVDLLTWEEPEERTDNGQSAAVNS